MLGWSSKGTPCLTWCSLMLFALALTACASTQSGPFCSIAEPIYAEPQDKMVISDALVAQLNAHNEVGRALCQWAP